jgi:hypothetical protein
MKRMLALPLAAVFACACGAACKKAAEDPAIGGDQGEPRGKKPRDAMHKPVIPADAVEDTTLAPLPGMDAEPLPENVFLRIQAVELGDFTRANYRVLLWGDGRLFVQQNSQADHDVVAPAVYADPYPASPTKVLDAAVMTALRKEIDAQRFTDLASGYRSKSDGSEGALRIMEIRLDQDAKRVITRRVNLPALEVIEERVWAAAR